MASRCYVETPCSGHFHSFLMNTSKIPVWNVRGLNKKACCDSVREVVNSVKSDIVCFQETKVANLSRYKILSMLGSSFDGWHVLPASGSRGGILVAWKSTVRQMVTIRTDNYSIPIQFCEYDEQCSWFTRVYGP